MIKMTNYERIKQMSIDEMSEFLFRIAEACGHDDRCGNCDTCPLKEAEYCTKDFIKLWLESEVTE